MVILAIHVFMFHVRGQDFLIDWCSVFDAVDSLMTRTLAVNLPPWKLPVQFSKIDDHLQKAVENLISLASEDEQTNPFLLPRLAENWENLTEESGSFRGVDLLPGWLVTNIEEEQNSESSRKKKSKKCTWIARFLVI